MKLCPKLIHIKLKEVNTPYLQRASRELYAKKLEAHDETWDPGLKKNNHLRVIDLSADKWNIQYIPLAWIESIDGASVEPPKTEWEVKGSSGNTYTVRLKGDRYICNCKGFMYRKKCKHVDQVFHEILLNK